MLKTIYALSLFAILCVSSESRADETHPPLSLPDEGAQLMIDVAKEFEGYDIETSLVPFSLERDIVNHAVFWSTIYVCGLNNDNMGPSLEKLLTGQELTKDQEGYVGTLHGMTTGLIFEQLELSGCPDSFKSYILETYGADLSVEP